MPEYNAWVCMRQRCNNPNHPKYPNYGGRGIVVSPEWGLFKAFFADMGCKPTSKHMLERKDNNGNYCKENCCWATNAVQSNNRRDNKVLSYNGKTQTISQWAEKLGINKTTLNHRVMVLGWSVEKALTKPVAKNGCWAYKGKTLKNELL